MTFHFTQTAKIRRVGFANSASFEIGEPTPVLSEFVGSVPDSDGNIIRADETPIRLSDFDRHPYIARTGTGNAGTSMYGDETVRKCVARCMKHYEGNTETVWSKDYGASPAFWGLFDEPTAFPVYINYDKSVWLAWELPRISWAYVEVVDKNDVVRRFENVAAVPDVERRTDILRLWGKTEANLSEDQRVLFIPWREIR